MYVNLFDSHVHSDNSHDGEHSITFLCENAQQKDLMGLCITDHYEMELNEAQADICPEKFLYRNRKIPPGV